MRYRTALAVTAATLVVSMCATSVSAAMPAEESPLLGGSPVSSPETHNLSWADGYEDDFYDRYVIPAARGTVCVLALPAWWAGPAVGALECYHVLEVGLIVSSYAEELFPDDPQRHNAFRHCLWSGWLTLDFGARAVRATDAHEVGASDGEIDRLIDLINNAIGAYVATLIDADDSLSDREKDQSMAFSCWWLAQEGFLAGVSV